MGGFGNVVLAGGELESLLSARTGEVPRSAGRWMMARVSIRSG
jgi:hypothetical protein